MNTNQEHHSVRMMSTILAFLLTALLWAGCSGNLSSGTDGSPEDFYRNPVFEPDLADPTLLRAPDGWFYAYGTENTWDDKVHHVIPVVRSGDLIHWEFAGDAFQTKPNWKEGGVWAPDIVYLNGKYHLYYALSTWGDQNAGIGLAISDKPEGPFTDQGKVFDSKGIGVFNSIDPCFVTFEGQNYLLWGSLGGGVYAIELSTDGRRIKGEKFQLAGNSFEAAYIFKKGAFFYLFVSTGTCCEGANSVYRVVAGRSEKFEGPYLTPKGIDLKTYNNCWTRPCVDGIDGVILQGNDLVAGPGHNGQIITDDNGDDWFVYHAILRTKPLLPDGATRRPMFIDNITWTSGWPVIHEGKGPSTDKRIKPFFRNQ
jgi:arabinan endo-1,5-alpha-L-arabinosidase